MLKKVIGISVQQKKRKRVKPSGPFQSGCEPHEPFSCACGFRNREGGHILLCDGLYDLLEAKMTQTHVDETKIKIGM